MNNITEQEIEKCPFCNGEAILIKRGNEHTKKRSAEIECTNCHVKLVVGAIRNSLDWCVEKVCEKWNKRVQNKVTNDPATPESTENWQKVGDKDKFMDEVRGKENGKIKQSILSAYYSGFNQAHYSHIHPEIFPPKECESAGKEYMIKKEKQINSDLEEYASIVNRKDNVGVNDAIEFADWLSGEGYTQYDGKERWIAIHNSNHVYTTEELYLIFKSESKQKKH